MGLGDFIKGFDGFRTTVSDLQELGGVTTTKSGGFVSVFLYGLLGYLLLGQAGDFLSTKTVTAVDVDTNTDSWLLVNFDFTMLDLPCEFSTISVKDVFGLERYNITQDIEKVHLKVSGTDVEEGDFSVEKQIDHANKEARPIELDRNGKHALEENGRAELEKAMRSHHLTFVLFFAPWCRWCQMLMPTWEQAAEKLDSTKLGRKDIKVKMVTFNCVKYEEGCQHFRIRSFPSMMLFKGTKPLEEYNGHRTVEEMVNFIKPFVKKFGRKMANLFHNLGCRMSGRLLVSRVPGNFHIEAAHEAKNLAPSQTNVSHIINHLSFGPSLDEEFEDRLPEREREMIHPLNGQTFSVDERHQAPQHYLKVATTQYLFKGKTWTSYTMSSTNRVRQYDEDAVPSAKFEYDISAIRTTISQAGISWYHFITNCLAIIGGAYTFMTLLWGGFDTVKKKLIEGKQD